MSNLRQKLFESRNIAGISVVMPAMNISDHDRFLRRADEIRRFLYLGCVLIRTLFAKLDEGQLITIALDNRIPRIGIGVLPQSGKVRASGQRAGAKPKRKDSRGAEQRCRSTSFGGNLQSVSR